MELALRIDAVQIEVVEFDRPAAGFAFIFMNERKGGTCDLVGISGIKRLGDAFDQGGLTGSKIAMHDHQLGGLEKARDLVAAADGIGSAIALELINLCF